MTIDVEMKYAAQFKEDVGEVFNMINFFKTTISIALTLSLSGCFLDSKSDEDSGVAPVGPTGSGSVGGQCSATEANDSLFSYLQDWYYWESELPGDFDGASQPDIYSAMDALRVEQDRFSFILTDEEYADYQASVFFGYGFSQIRNDGNDGLSIRYVFDEGSAAQGGLRRGDTITAVDGKSIATILAEVDAGTNTLGDVFGPNEEGHTIAVTFEKPDGTEMSADFSKGRITANTVMATQIKNISVDGVDQKVGYLVFDSFDDRSEQELNESFNYFAQENIDEMILDLRYNGGGLIRVAGQLSTQIAGAAVEGEVFVDYKHNDKQQGQNRTSYFSLGAGIEKMDLDKVVVLTSRGSCSASELVINALEPFINVVTVGDNTCGKPVGMYPTDVCDYVVFAINFETVNAEGTGGYFDGLEVDCPVTESITGDWGVDTDPLLVEGLSYLTTGRCSNDAGAVGYAIDGAAAIKKHVPGPHLDYRKGPWAAKNVF